MRLAVALALAIGGLTGAALAQPAPSPNAVRLRGYATASLPACAAGQTGMVAFDSTTGTLKKCNGSAWVATTSDVGTVTGTLAVANGGTGAATLTANNVILGNGTSAVQFVAPSTSGNVLTSNGTTWTSATPAASGGSGWPPTAPGGTYDDEFTATTLDARWTTDGTPSIGSLNIYDNTFSTANGWRYSLTDRSGWMLFQASSHDSYKGMTQTGMTIATNAFAYVRIQSLRGISYTTNDGEFDFSMKDGSRQFTAFRKNDSVGCGYIDGGGFTVDVTSTATYYDEIEYLGIGKVSTTYHCWIADATGRWLWLGSQTIAAMSPDRVAVQVHNNSAHTNPGLIIYALDFLRYKSGATPAW